MSTIQEIEDAVRKLSPDEYGLFREWLCTFEHEQKVFDLHPEWAAELTRRVNNLVSGRTTAIPAEDVMAEARARLNL